MFDFNIQQMVVDDQQCSIDSVLFGNSIKIIGKTLCILLLVYLFETLML